MQKTGQVPQTPPSSLSIEGLRARSFHSHLSLIKEIHAGSKSFRSFLVSYRSDGLRVFARVNLPLRRRPANGFPAVLFAHGFSPNPLDLNYFQRPYYEAWTNAYAKAGFIVIMPGYRGHGVVDGEKAQGGTYLARYSKLYLTSPFYAIDVLNLVASLTSLTKIDFPLPKSNQKSGHLLDTANMFLAAHSMGGEVALILLTASGIFNAASIWAGVTASLSDVVSFYTNYELAGIESESEVKSAIQDKLEEINEAIKEPPFLLDDVNAWIGYYHLDNLTTPLLLHHGMEDTSAPYTWSLDLQEKLKRQKKQCCLYLYKGNDHELSRNNAHRLAIERDVNFFNTHIRKEN